MNLATLSNIQELVERAIVRGVDLEYPGYLAIPHATNARLVWVVGTANVAWGVDLQTIEGVVLDSFELGDPAGFTSDDETAAAIVTAIRAREMRDEARRELDRGAR